MFAEEGQIGVEHEVRRGAFERSRHGEDVLLGALEFDERADGGFVDGDHQSAAAELLAVFLVPKPDIKTQSLEQSQ